MDSPEVKELLDLAQDEAKIKEKGLHAFVLLKKAQEFLASVKIVITPAANEQYVKLKEQFPDKKKIVFEDMAELSDNPIPVSYIYPPEVVELEKRLKEAKSYAISSGRATRNEGKLDPRTNQFFKMHLLDA